MEEKVFQERFSSAFQAKKFEKSSLLNVGVRAKYTY